MDFAKGIGAQRTSRRRIQRGVVVAIGHEEPDRHLAAKQRRREHITRNDKPYVCDSVDIGIDASI